MVARLIEGWESSTAVADYAGKWTFAGTPAIGTAGGRNGNGLRATQTSHNVSRVFAAQATWVVGFAFRFSGVGGTLLALLDGATIHCGVSVDTAGVLSAWRATPATVLGTGSATVPANTWVYVEAKFTINDTTGVAVVRLNGATVLTLSAQDTRNAGNASATTVRIGPTATLTGGSMDFDDLYVVDTTGSANTDFLGDCKVELVLPSGAGATTAWTPSAGSNYQCVDEAPPTADTDYVASSTAAQTDTYACGDLTVATSGAVLAVQATALARKDDAGSRSLALVARPGSTDRVGATQAVADTYTAYSEVWNTNPDTSAAWTVAETNASQFGQRLIA